MDIESLQLSGKRCLITGSSQGIGAAVARLYGHLGMHIAVHYRGNEDLARRTAHAVEHAGGTAVLVQQDLFKPDGGRLVVEKAIDLLGGLDILVNNAGSIIERRPLVEFDAAFIEQVLSLNIRSAVLASQTAAAHFIAHNVRGVIINTSSTGARNGGGRGVTLYAASKGFINTFTRGLAQELVGNNIRVNAVSPGVTATGLQGPEYTPPEYLQAMEKLIPMGRIATPEDSAGAFLFLASDTLSGYVTGQIIEVNGGTFSP